LPTIDAQGNAKAAYGAWIDVAPVELPYGCVLALRLDFMKGDAVVCSVDCWNVAWWDEMPGYVPGPLLPGLPSAGSPVEAPPEMQAVFSDPASHRVCVTGDPRIALRCPSASQYWSGSVHRPIAKAEHR